MLRRNAMNSDHIISALLDEFKAKHVGVCFAKKTQ